MDPVSDPSGEDLQKIVDGLKRTHRLEMEVEVHLSAEPFVLGKTVRDGDVYRIYLSEAEPYPLLHEFYHVLAEERILKNHIGSGCGFCTKIVLEMQNTIVDLAIEKAIRQTGHDFFPAYFPRIQDNLGLMERCGVIYFDPTRTVAYNLYLETAIRELYPHLKRDYDFWRRIELSEELKDRVESALEIAGRFVRKGRLGWKDITGATVDLSWAIFEADVMLMESRDEYRILCNTDHQNAQRTVSEMVGRLKKLSLDRR
ncbi:MAG: hypothetical protein U9N48_09355 [Euryarchaeota archaeon]|nr:hypothetical protein [Euryarchaeota archaeon]